MRSERTKQNQAFRSRWALAILCSMLLAVRCHAAQLIVHKSVPVEAITIQDLRAIYTMGFGHWQDGTPIQVFVLPQRDGAHQSFCRSILQVFPHQLQAVWDRMVYSGMGKAPTEVKSQREMIERIRQTPGAIGYVEQGNDVSDEYIRSIQVRP